MALEDLLLGNPEVLVLQVVQLAPKHVNVLSSYTEEIYTVHSCCIMLVIEVVKRGVV